MKIKKYGIEITKPWSKEMYAHNDKVADEMKKNLLKQWKDLIYEIDPETDWENFGDNESVVKLQKGICWSGYGSGYTLGDVNNELKNEVEMMANWQLHEEYGYGVHLGLLPKVKFPMLGFADLVNEYHTEVSIPCSLEQDMEWANASENVQ